MQTFQSVGKFFRAHFLKKKFYYKKKTMAQKKTMTLKKNYEYIKKKTNDKETSVTEQSWPVKKHNK